MDFNIAFRKGQGNKLAKYNIKESSRLRAEFGSDDSKERIKHLSRKGLNLPLSGPVPLTANSCSCSAGPGMLGSQCDALSHPQPPAASEPQLTPLSESSRPWVQTRPAGNTHLCFAPAGLLGLPGGQESRQGPRAGTPSLSHHPAHVSALYFRRATGLPPP